MIFIVHNPIRFPSCFFNNVEKVNYRKKRLKMDSEDDSFYKLLIIRARSARKVLHLIVEKLKIATKRLGADFEIDVKGKIVPVDYKSETDYLNKTSEELRKSLRKSLRGISQRLAKIVTNLSGINVIKMKVKQDIDDVKESKHLREVESHIEKLMEYVSGNHGIYGEITSDTLQEIILRVPRNALGFNDYIKTVEKVIHDDPYVDM